MNRNARPNSRFRRVVLFALASLVLMPHSGCAVRRYYQAWSPFGRMAPCVLASDATRDDIVLHLNRNISKNFSWQSTDVKIHSNSFPIGADAWVAVESPRNFRLVAKTIRGHEADLGSNPERFWFWSREAPEKQIMTVKHEQLDDAQRVLPLPFEPDWLMQALGVIPIDMHEFELVRSNPQGHEVQLVSDFTTPAGQRVRKVLSIDLCRGHVTQQALFDAANQLIAQATFSDFQVDRETGIEMAHRIHLDWPQMETSLSLSIGRVEFNPHEMANSLWEMPTSHPVFDIGEEIRRRRAGVMHAAPVSRQ